MKTLFKKYTKLIFAAVFFLFAVPCSYRMRTTDPGCTGCADRDEDQSTEAGGGK